MSAVYRTGTVDGMALGSRDIIKVRFKDPSSFGATDVNKAIISYRQYGKLEWTNVTYDVATTVANGADDKLTKVNDNGADHEYYVVYLPTDESNNYNLTNGGLWDKTAYASASYTLAGEKYEVKVHFRNTSGDGGLSEDTVKMVSP